MKTLSLIQPWASLIAIGAKGIETRSWPTRYRGPLAIHASVGLPVASRRLILSSPFREALTAGGLRIGRSPINDQLRHDLPLGAIVAVCKLSDCVRVEEVFDAYTPTRHERAFGDYTAGRWAWVLSNVVALPKPIPARGSLGLWEWDAPPGVAR